MFKRYLLSGLFLAIGGFILCFAAMGQAQKPQKPSVTRNTPLKLQAQRSTSVKFAKTAPARTFAAAVFDRANELRKDTQINEQNTRSVHTPLRGPSVDGILNSSAKARAGGKLSNIWKKAVPFVPTGGFDPHVLLTFEGVAANGVAPPDTNAAVGPNHIVETVNLLVQVYDKSGNPIGAPFYQSDLYSAMPNSTCALTNDGDPIVLYDRLADRWVITQFGFLDSSSAPYYECVAVSQTGDPTGAYYAYEFELPGNEFPDYPKLGTWLDAYYMTSNQFCELSFYDGVGVFAFNRTKMLVGDPTAELLYIDLDYQGGCNPGDQPPAAPEGIFSMLPSDHSGLLPPPLGTPNSFIYFTSVDFGDPADGLRVFDFYINPGFTGGAFVEETTYDNPLPLAPFDPRYPGDYEPSRQDIGQPSPAIYTDDNLDSVGGRTMYPLRYNNRNGAETIVGNLTVNVSGIEPVDPDSYTAGFRYFELVRACPTCYWAVNQQSTIEVVDVQAGFVPAHAWMTSAAIDNEGNIGFGYSVSDLYNFFPSIAYGAINAFNPPDVSFVDFMWQGTAPQQDTGNRWGDYSSLVIDPVDDCTFWHANEYYTVYSSFNWQTRIGSFKLSDSCTPPAQGTLAGVITACNSGAPLAMAMMQVSNGTSTTTQPINNGGYSMQLAPGNYTVNVIDPSRFCNQAGPFSVTVNANQTTTVNACLTGVPQPVVDPGDPTLEVVTGGNNNGIIDANECNMLTVIAKNVGCAPATHVTGVLSTSTPNVLITQPNASYLDMPLDGSSANTTPFKVSTAPGFVCGTPIAFTLTLNYTGGSVSSSFSIPTCTETAPPQPYSGVLQNGDLVQQARLGRNSQPSTCAGKPCPGPLSSGNRRYDTFNFVNGPADACVTISITNNAPDPTNANPALAKAYLNSYDPIADPTFCTNYLGDEGSSYPSGSFQVEMPANQTLVVVVEDSGNNVVTTNTPYTGLVSGLAAAPVAGPGICKIATSITTQASAQTHVQGGVFDAATVTPQVSGGPTPTGTVTFRLFGPNQATCGGALVFMSTVPVTPIGPYDSDSFFPTVAGTYRWIASYSGDANYNPSTGMCNDANESVVVLPQATNVNGTGTVLDNGNQVASFYVNAFFRKPGKPTGSVDLTDNAAGVSMSQAKVTSLSFVGDCAYISGTAKIGKHKVTFSVVACDYGSPGPGVDYYAISISNGYSASGYIASGSIVLTP